jgi:GTP-binding protein HflX
MLDPADGAGLSWLHRHTEVLGQAMDETNGRLKVTVRGDSAAMERVKAKFGR